jgi:hypothetical protein
MESRGARTIETSWKPCYYNPSRKCVFAGLLLLGIQDDYLTSGGTKGFEAPTGIRADQFSINDVRLPYFKYPRNPTDGASSFRLTNL